MAIKSKEMEAGCFSAAMDDEPMFVLLARDPSAPHVVRNWATRREAAIAIGRRPKSDAAKVAEARATADAMALWRHANQGKWRKDE